MLSQLANLDGPYWSNPYYDSDFESGLSRNAPHPTPPFQTDQIGEYHWITAQT